LIFLYYFAMIMLKINFKKYYFKMFSSTNFFGKQLLAKNWITQITE
jgi:hypothetical protein